MARDPNNLQATLKHNYVASLDQLINEEDKVAERLVQTKPRVKETAEMQIARLKDPRTISVATFGQQGKFDAFGGQFCTSPPALSPPSHMIGAFESQKPYWRMEETSAAAKVKDSDQIMASLGALGAQTSL